jgi:transcriptional regulator with XRE-family HTH domain
VSVNTFGDTPPLRRRLARHLAQLRRASKISGTALAEMVGQSQSTISRIEHAAQAPTVATVKRWCEAVGADPATTAELVELAETVSTEIIEWRHASRHGYTRLQRDMHAVEAEATAILEYSPLLLPGLLQTADAARRIIESFGLGPTDVTQAIAARLERQAVLLDSRKSFDYVLAEPILRWRLGPRPVMRGQLERILQVAALPHVEMGIIPSTAEMSSWPGHAFAIYEGPVPMVLVETLTTGLSVSEPDAVQMYRDTFHHLRAAAVRGSEMLRLVEEAQAALA